MNRIANNVLDLIGNTPMVKINKLTRKDDATILAKLEKFNPAGSVKDRMVKFMIEQAEKEGKLTKDKIILEATSGNTGIGLAMIGAIKGYKSLSVMPDDVSEERKVMIKAFGGEILLVPKERGEAGSIEMVNKLIKEEPDKYFLLNQFNSHLNPLAHYETIGKEIIEQTDGKLDMLVAGLGTTGTIMGVSKRLKEFNPKIKIVAVEPFFGEVIPGLRHMKEAYTPSIWDESKVDEKVNVSLEDAITMTKRIAREEGLFVGISSGAAMWVAVEKAKELGKEKTIVVILPDLGERYISTDVFK